MAKAGRPTNISPEFRRAVKRDYVLNWMSADQLVKKYKRPMHTIKACIEDSNQRRNGNYVRTRPVQEWQYTGE